MNRQQAVQWCVDNIIEWPEFKPSIAPDGWYWTECFGQWVLDAGETSVPISKQSWLICKGVHRGFNHSLI